MASKVRFSYKDYDEEVSSVQFTTVPITAANFDAQVTAMNNLSTAILGVQTEASLQSKMLTAVDDFISRAKATEKATQREHRWILTLEDTVTHRLTTHQIPQADVSLISTDSDVLDLSTGPGATLKTAVEAMARFPGTNNPVLLLSVTYTGSRS